MATLLHPLEITLQSLVPTVCQRPNNSEHQGNTGDSQCNVQVGIPTHVHSNLLNSLPSIAEKPMSPTGLLLLVKFAKLVTADADTVHCPVLRLVVCSTIQSRKNTLG